MGESSVARPSSEERAPPVVFTGVVKSAAGAAAFVWRAHHGHLELLLGEVVVVGAHEAHELAVHPEDDELLEVRLAEQRVPLILHSKWGGAGGGGCWLAGTAGEDGGRLQAGRAWTWPNAGGAQT